MELLPVNQIKVSETIVGKGAFGEVRKGRWKNLEIAYKRLFVLQEGNDHLPNNNNNVNNAETTTTAAKEGEQQQSTTVVTGEQQAPLAQPLPSLDSTREIEMLSKLRHPNLLLFLGICKEATSPQPSIITELMSYSLYDLLEIHKIHLLLPDILDISRDICNGLDYLHSYTPPIIHRDISSKNILLNGKSVKIADLGQAKMFHFSSSSSSSSTSAMSKQTGIPGAMAYSAPEVLTGKYSTKIDIFSFGILLCQMCNQEYPRIDYRQEQIKKALQAFPILTEIIHQTLQFHPSERPDADSIGNDLLNIIENDRYYPITRHALPEKDIGILGYHLFTKQMNLQYQETIQQNEKLIKLLKIEELRWKQEANKVDLLQQEKEAMAQLLQQEKERTTKALLENHLLEEQKAKAIDQQNQLLLQLNILSSEIQSLQSHNQSLDTALQQKDSQLQQKNQQLHASRQTQQEQQTKLSQQIQQYEQLQQKLALTTKQLNMQVEYCKDLEVRLEQILTRWKEEKELYNAEKTKTVSLQSAYSQMQQQKEQLALEYQRCDYKLRQYEGLPMPEEIKLRFTDLQHENDLLREKVHELITEKEVVMESKEQLQANYAEQEKILQDLHLQIQQKESYGKTKEMEIIQLQSSLQQQKKVLQENDLSIKQLKSEKDDALKRCEELQDKIKMISNELLQEKKVKSQLSLKLQQLTSMSSPTLHGNAAPSLLLPSEQSAEHRPSTSGEVASPALHQEQSEMVGSSHPNEINVERLSEVAIKHLVERTAGRESVKGLVELIMNNTHDDRILWRALRSIRELIISDTSHAAMSANHHPQTSHPPPTTATNREIIQQTNPEIWLIELFLKAYPKNRMIISQVMRFIGTYTFGNDLFRRKIGERQIMLYIIQILQSFPQDEMVLLHTTMALTNLTHGSKENRSRYAEGGGILLLIQLMYQHLSNQKLQIQFCWSLLTLSGSDEIAIEISQQKGDLLVIQSILTHKEDASIQEYGLWTLYNISLASSEIATMLQKKGLLELCQIAIEQHRNQEKVMQQVHNIQGLFSSTGGVGPSPAPTITASNKKKLR